MRRFLAVVLSLSVVTLTPAPATPVDARWPVCGEWREVPVPGDAEFPGGFGNVRDVDVVSPTEAWIVSDFGYESFNEGHVYRWDGRRWGEVPFPPPPTQSPDERYWVLDDLEIVSPTDGWVVGMRATYGTWVDRPLVARWNGARWRHVPIGIPGLRGTLEGVARVPGTDDLIAVGRRSTSGQGEALVLRWNGRAWHRMPAPTPGRWSQLADVVTVGGTVVAVGTGRRAGERPRLLALRLGRDGWSARWGPRGWVAEADASAPDRIWAVGSTMGGASIVRWNGRAWRIVRRFDRVDEFLDVVTPAPGVVWAVGSAYHRPWNTSRGYIVRGDGGRWAIDHATSSAGYFSAIGGTPRNLWTFLSYPPVEYAELWRFSAWHRC